MHLLAEMIFSLFHSFIYLCVCIFIYLFFYSFICIRINCMLTFLYINLNDMFDMFDVKLHVDFYTYFYILLAIQ